MANLSLTSPQLARTLRNLKVRSLILCNHVWNVLASKWNTTGKEINNLLLALGLPVGGALADRRERFMKYIGFTMLLY